MQITEPTTHHAAPRAHPAADLPSARRLLDEPLDLIEFVPIAGPPAILLVGPLVLLALMVAGPFVVVLTIVAALIVATALVALAGAILVSPFLLVRHLRGRRTAGRRSISARAPKLVPLRSRRAAA